MCALPQAPDPYLPSGEKDTLCTEPLKWKWCSTDLHTRLTSSASPPAGGTVAGVGHARQDSYGPAWDDAGNVHPPPHALTPKPKMVSARKQLGETTGGAETPVGPMLALSHPAACPACPPSCLRAASLPRALTFIDDDGQAAVWRQPYALDVVPRSQGQSVGFVAERQKPERCSWSQW